MGAYGRSLSTVPAKQIPSISTHDKLRDKWKKREKPMHAMRNKELRKDIVRMELVQVLTSRTEQMLLDRRPPIIQRLRCHSANVQSVTEERWTDYDAISLMSYADYVTPKKMQNQPVKIGISDWLTDLERFKLSMHNVSSSSKMATHIDSLDFAVCIPNDNDTTICDSKVNLSTENSNDYKPGREGFSNLKSKHKASTLLSHQLDQTDHLLVLARENLHALKYDQNLLGKNGCSSSTIDSDAFSLKSEQDGGVFDSQTIVDSLEVSRPSLEFVLEPCDEKVVSQSDIKFTTETGSKTESVKSTSGVSKSKKKWNSNDTSIKKSAISSTSKTMDLKRMSYFNQDLHAYVEACGHAGMVNHAQQAVNFYRFNGKQGTQKKSSAPAATEDQQNRSHFKIQDIAIYNMLMHAWAKQGKLEKIRQIFSHLHEEGKIADMQSYAACLECLGRQGDTNMEITERVLADMEKDGYDVKDVFNQCIFAKDERQIIYQAIRRAVPHFQPNPPQGAVNYNNPLVNCLNENLPADQVVERNPYHGVITAEELQSRMKTQMQLEVLNDLKVPSVVKRDPPNEKALSMRNKLQMVEESWRGMITKGLERKLKYMERKNKREHGLSLYPYLRLFDTEEYIDLLMKEIHILATESEHFSPTTGYLWRRLGTHVHNKYIIHKKVKNKVTKKILGVYRPYTEQYSNEAYCNHRVWWQELCNQSPDGPTLDKEDKSWPVHVVKGLGKLLYDIILHDIKFDANILKNTDDRKKVPSFYTVYRNYGHVTKEELKPHPSLVKLYHGAELRDLTFETGALPMLVPPVPWTSIHSGGYLLSSTKLVRLPESAQSQKVMLEITPREQLNPIFDTLNTLGACAWTINTRMLDLIVEVFNKKGNKDLDIPAPVSEAPPLPRLSKDMSSDERSKAFQERLRVKQQRSEMYSLWCNELYRLSIANKFRDEIFWFPHNMDFRGRTYPCPPHFNHLGSDVTRSILLFAKGKPLGEKGLDWLKIHLVNLTGFKKRSSNADRLAFAEEILPEILDSADNPMNGGKWWQASDEPWQTLAVCMEITKAARSPDHTEFVSHFPVHQDGSCNGLQHYAALGRDQAGAESVNLYPFDQPKDVYSDVAEMVERQRRKDAAEGNELAQVLEGFVRRKVIKQTVMTTVYGVTRYGAKYQILRQLKDIPEFPQQLIWSASAYLTEKTFYCLQEMFSSTKEIQDWFTVSAHLIATICNKPVQWVTPLGFPIVQPYHKTIISSGHGAKLTDKFNMFEKPNAMKQKNAFPPNFIHSLDSTHMMLTALFCMQAGITYVSVHDCFWTHACDVELMNKITRDQFISLHSRPILEDLSAHLLHTFARTGRRKDALANNALSQDYLHSVLSRVPKRGEFDLNNVMNSTYFFS